MKIFLLFAAVGAALANNDHYITADDNLDMVAVTNNPMMMTIMTDCFLDRGPCDHVAQSYKDILPDAVMKGCQRCTDAQKHSFNTYLRSLRWVFPHYFSSFLAKYDPQNFFFGSFMEAVKDY